MAHHSVGGSSGDSNVTVNQLVAAGCSDADMEHARASVNTATLEDASGGKGRKDVAKGNFIMDRTELIAPLPSVDVPTSPGCVIYQLVEAYARSLAYISKQTTSPARRGNRFTRHPSVKQQRPQASRKEVA